MSDQMRIQVLFFATLRDQAGQRQVELVLPAGTTIGELKKHLSEKTPGLSKSLSIALAAINKEVVGPEKEIPPGAEVAFFPPVSGGSGQSSYP